MNLIEKLSEEKYSVWIRWLSLISQVVILILALTLLTNIATRQYNYAQMETVRVEIFDQMYKDSKEFDEKLKLLKEELTAYQNTREGRAKFFGEKVVELEHKIDQNHERINRRVDNLNTKQNYWTGKVKKAEIEAKLKKQ